MRPNLVSIFQAEVSAVSNFFGFQSLSFQILKSFLNSQSKAKLQLEFCVEPWVI